MRLQSKQPANLALAAARLAHPGPEFTLVDQDASHDALAAPRVTAPAEAPTPPAERRMMGRAGCCCTLDASPETPALAGPPSRNGHERPRRRRPPSGDPPPRAALSKARPHHRMPLNTTQGPRPSLPRCDLPRRPSLTDTLHQSTDHRNERVSAPLEFRNTLPCCVSF